MCMACPRLAHGLRADGAGRIRADLEFGWELARTGQDMACAAAGLNLGPCVRGAILMGPAYLSSVPVPFDRAGDLLSSD